MSSFFGLNIARSALTMAQKGLDVTGHNIANANTVGYSRQRLLTSAVEPPVLGSRFAVTSAATGGGVKILTVDQIRNPFLDAQYRQEYNLASQWSTRAEHLSYIESLFDELSDTGLTKALSQFADSLQELSRDPSNMEYRTNLLQQSLKLVETFHHYSKQQSDKLSELDQTVVTLTSQVNDITRSIADLNKTIAQYELGGQQANDLRDQRNVLLDRLAGLIDYRCQEDEMGRLKVTIGYQTLIDHDQVRSLTAVADQENPLMGATDYLHRIVFEETGEEPLLSGGQIKAILNLRDGSSKDNIGIPYLSAQLDTLAASLAASFNEIHAQGWTLPDPEAGLPSSIGRLFFAQTVDEEGQPLPIGACNIQIDPVLIDRISQIAASSLPVTSEAMSGNNENILQLVQLFHRQDIPGVGSFNGFVQSLTVTLGIEVSHAKTRSDNQAVLVDSLEQQRQSVSGVSLDEEMTQLIRMQHSYTAAARMINAIDECLDILINKTGLAGR
ncbi:MAG: flagellar hook-associated protein FlgK [Clostridia bacterium]|nr:flagellar hook-associated protein FlgK [Clostridia bacterium]